MRLAEVVEVVEVKGLDRARLLRDVSAVLADHHVNIVACNTVTGSDRISKMRFDFELGDPSHLDSVIGGIKQIDGIYDAYRVLPGKGEVALDRALADAEADADRGSEPQAVPAGEQGAGLNL